MTSLYVINNFYFFFKANDASQTILMWLMAKEMLKQRALCQRNRSRPSPQPGLPGSDSTQPIGRVPFHPDLSPGHTSRSPCQAQSCPPATTPSSCHQSSFGRAVLRVHCREPRWRPGKLRAHLRGGSGLTPEPSQQTICLWLSIPEVFGDQRNGLV